MTLLKNILLALGATFSIFGYLIYFKKKYNLINDFEANRKADRKQNLMLEKLVLLNYYLELLC